MSADVHITKEGLKAFHWNGDIREYEEVQPESYIPSLRSSCEIDLGVTLGDIFNAVDQHKDLKDFIGPYSWCHVDAYHEEAKRTPLHRSDLKYLEVYSCFEYGEGLYASLHGIGEPEEQFGGTNYAVEFTPVNEMVHLEVRLNRNCTVMGDDLKLIKETEICYSLLEVLDAIYYEISFVGLPTERDQLAAELHETVKGIKDGTVETHPWEELENKLKEKIN